MSFLGFVNVGPNLASVLPIQDDDEDDGYTTANESFPEDPKDYSSPPKFCNWKCLQRKDSADLPNSLPRRRDSIASDSLPRRDSIDKIPKCLALTDPIRLDRKCSSNSLLHDENEKRSKTSSCATVGIVPSLLELLRGFRLGSDVTKLQLPPQFNLPKSQLQVYGEAVYCCAEDYLGMCDEGESPVERLLAVVRFHLSTTRPAPFLKAPYNPVLGESHHVSVGELNVICEQVSHHPPVSALYATNDAKEVEMLWWHQPVPRFYGGYVEATIVGQRRLTLRHHQETYEFSSPALQIRFLPSAGTAWVGATTVKCRETGLEAVVNFKAKPFFGMRGSSNKVSGKVVQKSSGEVLYEINGNWDGIVSLKNKSTGITSTLYDAQAAMINIHAPKVANLEAISPSESVNVWSEVTMSLLNGDWETAREAKRKVEEAQRVLQKQRSATGTVWSPKYFTATKEGTWEWHCAGQSVASAPLVVE